MTLDLVACGVGVALGALHFGLFWLGTRTVLGLGAGTEGKGLAPFIMLGMLMRHLLLGVFFLGAWKTLNLPPLGLAAGVVLAWTVARLVLVARSR